MGEGMTVNPPGVEVRLEYPRQAIADLKIHDYKNIAYMNIYVIISIVLHVTNDIITNQM